MFLIVLLDVVQESLALEDLDVGGEADDEAAGAFDAVDGGLEDPGAIFPLQVSFRQWILFHQKALGTGVQLQDHLLYRRACHPEDIRLFDLVFILEGPGRLGGLNGMDAHYFEHPAVAFLHIVGPHVNHIGSEGEGLYQAVPRLVAMGRCIPLQHHLHLAFHGLVQRLDVRRIGGIVDIIGNAGAVIDAGQFPLQVPFQGVVVVDAFNHPGGQVGLLVGEVDELLEVGEAPGDLTHRVHIAVELVHHEAGLADGVDVAVHRPGRDAQFLCQRVDGAAHVPGEEFHQAEEFGDFRGVHRPMVVI